MKINIVCAGNRNFIIPMKVMLKSLAVNTRKNVEIFVLNKEWKGDDKIDFIETFSNNKNISIKIRMNPCFDYNKCKGKLANLYNI